MQPVDHRFVQPSPETLRKASPHLASYIIAQHLLDMANVEVSVIGDFINSEADVQEFEGLLLKYLGGIPSRTSLRPSLSSEGGYNPLNDSEEFKKLETRLPIISLTAEGPLRLTFTDKPRAWWFHLNDDEERSFVCLGFPTLNRWGQRGSPLTTAPALHSGEGIPQYRRGHVLFKSRAMNLLTDVRTSMS